MRLSAGFSVLLSVSALLAACGESETPAPPPSEPEPPAWTALFDGESLAGWSGNTGHWTVEDGCLVGRSTAEQPLERSVYLFHELEANDFILEFEYLLKGGNSGVQYRSKRLADGDVQGYQADMEDGPNYSGILYESAGRGIVATRSQRLEISADGERNVLEDALGTPAELQEFIHAQDWNHYRIEARGAVLTHSINRHRMVEVVDEQTDAARASGVFSIQLHQGPPMEVRYRDMRFTRLEPEVMRLAEWIWGPTTSDREQRWFLHRFWLERPVTLLDGLMTCDNGFQAWLDGELIGEGNDWAAPTVIAGGQQLAAGSHVLSVLATNDSGPAGLVAELPWQDASGQISAVVSSDSWLTTLTEPGDWPTTADLPAGWENVHSFGPVNAHSGPWGSVIAPLQTPEPTVSVADGFEVELIHTAAAGEGSWASFTFASDGSAYACGERSGLVRFRFPNGHDAPPQVETLDTPVVAAQGMLWVGDALYANVAGPADGRGGLHRLRDADGDGVFEEHEHLQAYGPQTEHAAHGIVLGPDGMLYTVQGNYTSLPDDLDADASPHIGWAEDELLPRIWDPRGHAHGILAPGGVVLRTDLDARRWELVAGGMRNPYDLAFAPDGELFTYDADMEWDIGAPWYRAPRVIHVVPGGESGWRSGSAKWPAAYPDSEPPVLETGPSSPVGICFGTGAAFPTRMQSALFLGDWANGRILTVQLEADGASYTGTQDVFISGSPLPVTDLEIGPDGALWFTTGGRGAQSRLYRVRYVGADSLAAPAVRSATPEAEVRRRLAAGQAAEAEIVTSLGHADRAIRAAARRVLERDAALRLRVQTATEISPLALAELRLARARMDTSTEAASVAEELVTVDFPTLSSTEQWLAIRAAMLLQMRAPLESRPWSAPLSAATRGWLDSAIANSAPQMQREVAALAVALSPSDLAPTLMQRFRAAEYPAARIHYANLLRHCDQGWAEGDREELTRWLRLWRTQPGGLSLAGFLSTIEQDVLGQLTPEAAAAITARLPQPTAPGLGVAVGRPIVRDWTVALAETELRIHRAGRTTDSPEDGARLFREVGCIQCHRRSGEGGSVGPDLSSVGARFGEHDLLEAILDPAKVRSDQYPWGVMPDGLADSLETGELAALLAFLRGDGS